MTMTTEDRASARQRLGTSFRPNRPIDVPEFLAGRSDVLYRTLDAVNTPGQHIILFGERGIGKTSVAKVLAYEAQEADKKDGMRALLTSCSSADTYSSIWQKICQEILIAQRQLGFAQQAALEITGRLALDAPVNDPNDVRLLIQSFPNSYLILIDEFDRLDPASDARRLMADTIKLFSDADVKATILIVGVAESIGQLVGEHLSTARNIAQIEVEPMKPDELGEIVRTGYEHADFSYEEGVDTKIAELSQGYPHYTHLLALWAGRRALQDDRTNVTDKDLTPAISDALKETIGGARQEYELAVQSSQPNNIFKQVLLACALAEKDSLGRFAAVDVRKPLREITGHSYDTEGFQSHLARFCQDDRGPILKKTGKPRGYRWHFIKPQIIPFINLRGAEEKMLPA